MNSHLDRLHSAVRTSTAGMTVEELQWHRRGKWSALEVLEHLSLTYVGTTKGFQKCLQAGRPLASVPRLRQRLATALVVGLGYLPSGRQAPENTRPKSALGEAFGAEIESMIVDMDKAIAECEASYGNSTLLLDHPILGPLTADQWRKFHWVHGKHHMKQIRGLRQALQVEEKRMRRGASGR